MGKSPGFCFRNALIDAGIIIPSNLDIPEWLSIHEANDICNYLGIEWLEDCNISIGVEPVIVIYKTGQGKAHALFVRDIGSLLGQFKIIGLIRVQTQSR